MKNRTVRVIIILVGLLILNIEAAHAGITHKFKVLISNEFSNFQLLYVFGGILAMALLSYVIFTPAFKEDVKSNLAATYFQSYSRHNFSDKKMRIKKITEILKNMDSVK